MAGGARERLRRAASYPIRDPPVIFAAIGIALLVAAAGALTTKRDLLANTLATYAYYALVIGVAGRFVQFLRARGVRDLESTRKSKVEFAGITVALISLVAIGGYHMYTLGPRYSFEVDMFDSNGLACLKVAIWNAGAAPEEGPSINLIGPGNEVAYKVYISLDRLIDGFEEVNMKFGGVGSRFITPKPGNYTLVVNGSISGEVIYEQAFSFMGAEVSVTRCSTILKQRNMSEYELVRLNVTVRNDGDMPAYVYSIGLFIGADNMTIALDSPKRGIVLPGESKAVVQDLTFPLAEGQHTVSLELKDGHGKVLATYETTIAVPP